jgi:hypothetical protein
VTEARSALADIGFLHQSVIEEPVRRRHAKVPMHRPEPTAIAPIEVKLTAHQLALLDEWIEARPDPKPSRGEAMVLHLDWSIARCSSRIDLHPCSTIPDEVTGKDVL